MAVFIFFYVFGLVILLGLAASFHLIEEQPKVAARLFLFSFVWPVVAVYMVARYGRTFITKTIETAELHEFVNQEQDMWMGAEGAHLGDETKTRRSKR